MGKHRKSSGFFETLIKSAFGFGTTVHRTRDWAGRNVTVVKHHDTGKSKTSTHGTGFFGTTTKTETRNGRGAVTETSTIKQDLLGSTVEVAKKEDGSGRTTKRVLDENLVGAIFRCVGGEGIVTTYDANGAVVGKGTPQSSWLDGRTMEYRGKCFGCEGKGNKQVTCNGCAGTGTFVGTCRLCAGSGTFQARPGPCHACRATGRIGAFACRRFSGSGQRLPPPEVCRSCRGTGKFSASCRRCSGAGIFIANCKRCAGTGVFQKSYKRS